MFSKVNKNYFRGKDRSIVELEAAAKEKQKEYQKGYFQKVTKTKRKNLSIQDSVKVFRREIMWGPIYPCISCHRTLFRRGVSIAEIEELKKYQGFRGKQ